jgi:hypothetical protein
MILSGLIRGPCIGFSNQVSVKPKNYKYRHNPSRFSRSKKNKNQGVDSKKKATDDDEEEEDPQPYHSEQIKALVTVGKTLKKVKKIVKLFNKALQLRELLIARTQLTLINDIKIRWNYTLLMINRYLELYDDVIDIVTNSTKHEKIYKKHFLTEDDIDLLNCLSALLKPFYTVTQILSGDTYITIDKVLHSILYIRDKINKFNPDESVPIQKKF